MSSGCKQSVVSRPLESMAGQMQLNRRGKVGAACLPSWFYELISRDRVLSDCIGRYRRIQYSDN